MDSTPDGDLIEEREELMVFPSESRQKTHLLQPCLTSIDESEAVLPRQNRSDFSQDLKALSLSVSFHGWRLAHTNFKAWARKMADLHSPVWRKAGIFDAIKASTYRIYKDTDLLLAMAEKWCPETNTFAFPWGETTITLEDVMVLLGFSVLGLPVFATLDSSEKKEILRNLEREWVKIKKDKVTFVNQVAWMKRFTDSGDELEHVAFLALWLSYFVFPSCFYHIPDTILPIAVHLSTGTKIALAPAVLAHLYADLTLLKPHIRAFNNSPDKIELSSLFKLVQVWTWERFKELQPKPNPIRKFGTRLALWCDLKECRSQVWQILENSKIETFEWRPYTKPFENWKFPKFYPEKAMWVPVGPNLDDEFISYARCIKESELVGIGFVEHYFPNRVASQFGMLQNVPSPVNQNKLSEEAAWNTYNKPIDDLTLYIPSRSTIPCVTPTFCESPELQSLLKEKQGVESAGTTKSRNIVDDDDDDDTSSVPSDSKMKRTNDDGMEIAEKSTKKRHRYMEPVGEDDPMGQVPSDNDDEEDDSLTVDQMRKRFEKKHSDVENIACEQLGKKSRLEADNNDAGHRQNLTLINKISKQLKLVNLNHLKHVGEKDESSGGEASEPLGKTSRLDANNNDPSALKKLASVGANGDETAVSPPEIEERNEETNEKKNNDESYGKSLHEVKVMAASLEERINTTQRKVAWLKERNAMKQRQLAAASLI